MSDHHTPGLDGATGGPVPGAGPAAPEQPAEAAARRVSAGAARLFDIRRVIGGLFVLYGAVLTVVGATDSAAEIAKAQGIRINLWTGLGMLALGAAFLVWLRLSPTEPPAGPVGDGPAPSAGRPATGTVPAPRDGLATDTASDTGTGIGTGTGRPDRTATGE